ncbi:hypothetical protein GQ53DRAFT_762208 [Thozetella sp. PMI_491]|nr:hypothetical protein GQ53DRAFT_762208 [Thozetella sp. PMI_491]
MQLTKIATLGLVGLASAAPRWIKRDLATIQADFAQISSQLTLLDTKLQAFTGNIFQGLDLYAGITTLETYIETTTDDITENGALSVDDSATLYATGKTTVDQLGVILDDILAKIDVIKSTGFTSLILEVLADVKADADDLFNALAANVDPSYSDELQDLQTTIDTEYDELIAAFN